MKHSHPLIVKKFNDYAIAFGRTLFETVEFIDWT